ncbi:uncharacterized protein LOC113643680 [Tachysurus ichikawai]
MKRLLLLDIIIYGILFSKTWAWSVKMPSVIHGLHKSCLVIPCRFTYNWSPPNNPYRIVWYQHVNRGYPLVFDDWHPTSVIDKYRGKTSLFKPAQHGDCSLVIEHLSPSHHRDRIYTWVDPEHIGWRTFKFYDFSTLIHIDSYPQDPIVTISGGKRLGDSITVQCKTYHTCPYKRPSLSLSGIEKKPRTDELKDEDIGDGKWEITLTRVGVIWAESNNIQCSVTHSGGVSGVTTTKHNAQCTYKDITIDPDVADVVEGVGKNFTCTVYHYCKGHPPVFTWNYKDLPETVETKKGPSLTWATYSNILYIASLEDDGKKLTCTAKFTGGEITSSIVLQVQSE